MRLPTTGPTTGPATRAARTAGALTAVVALVLAAAGCSAGDTPAAAPSRSPTSSATPTPTPLPTATTVAGPENKVCYRLTFAEAVAPTADDRAASCTQDHTAETYAVGTIDNVVDGHLVAVDSARVQTAVATTCPGLLPDLVGGTDADRRLSMVQAVWFTPTVEESDDGADWYVCDAVVLSGSKDLATLDTSLKGALATPDGRARYAMCGTAQPGTDGFTTVLCTDPTAAWRAISVVDFDQPDGPYPGEQTAKDRGQTTCADAGRSVAADPLNYKWAYEFPTADDWAAGQTYGRCWAPV